MNIVVVGTFSIAFLGFMIYSFFLAIRLVKAVEKIADQLERQ